MKSLFLGVLLSTIALSSPARAWTIFSAAFPGNVEGWRPTKISFFVNLTDCSISEDTLRAAIEKAASIWSSVPYASLDISIGENTTNTVAQYRAGTATDVPGIICTNDFVTDVGPEGNNIPGVGSASILTSDPTIDYGFLILNSDPGDDARIDNLSDSFLAYVLTHEIGHVLGFGHTQKDNSIMYYSAVDGSGVRLNVNDMDGVAYLYPREELGGAGLFGCESTVLAAGKDSNRPSNLPGYFAWLFMLALAGWAGRKRYF